MIKTTTRVAGILLAGAIAASATAVAAPPGNDARDDAAVTARGITVSIDVLANDPGATVHSQVRLRQRPAHGSARVVGQQVVYTPRPGFTGRDSLTYMAKSSGRPGMARVTIDVGEALRLQGRVTERGAGAAVTAWAGGHRFDASADANGDYVIDVVGSGDDMVRLESSRDEVVLASLVGGFEHLVAEAGDDGVLTRDENNRVQISRLSAAHAFLAQLANDGMPVESGARLAVVQGMMDLDELLPMSAAIKLVVDGTHALPGGVADTMELISDADAYQRFASAVRATDPDARDAAIAATVSDPDVIAPPDVASMMGAKWLLPASADGTIRVGLVAGERLVLAKGGSATYISTRPNLDTGATWRAGDTAVSVTPDVPPLQESISYFDGVPVRAVFGTVGMDLALLVDGGTTGRDVFGITHHTIVTYPDNPERPDLVGAGTRVAVAHREGVAGIPFHAGEFPATRTLPLHRPEIYGYAAVELSTGSNYAVHRFAADGTGTVTDDGQLFTWSLDGRGHLHLAYGDGETAEIVRLRQDGRKGDGVIALFHLADGSSKTIFALSSVLDGTLEFDAANLMESWRSGFRLSDSAHVDPLQGDFYVVLDGPGQTGQQVSFHPAGVDRVPLVWDVADGMMVARRYRDYDGWQVECTVGVNGCFLYRERRWVPISRSGNRIYLHEELWGAQEFTGGAPLALLSQRGNFYDIEVAPTP